MDQFEEIGYMLATLTLPFLIRYAFTFFQRRKQPKLTPLSRPQRPKTRGDHLSTYWLLLLGCIYIYYTMMPPFNFLKMIGASVDSPSFLVRNKFRDFMTQHYPGWIPMNSIYEKESPNKEIFEENLFQSQIAPMEELYDKLRASKWRRMYGRFGHEAITQCDWCEQPEDYGLFDFSKILLSYAFALIGLGLGTMTWRKIKWRLFSFLILMIPLSVDLYCYAFTTADSYLMILDKKMTYSLFEVTYRMRNFSFAILFFLSALWNSKDVYTDSEVLQDIIKKNGNTYARTMSLRLARAATFGNSELRNRFMEFYKQKEAERDAVERDVAYQDLRTKILSQNNLSQLQREANEFSNDVMQFAVQQGVLGDFDRLPLMEDL